MASARRRLDAELVRRGLITSREQAQRAIEEHQVTVNGSLATKSSHLVQPADAVEILGPPPRYVGRGGLKLEGALVAFGIDPTGWHCIDVGSSTGGFTDCLLQHGAGDVVAIDVGRAQLHERLRGDRRVEVREQTDIRSVDPAGVGAPFQLVVIDVSFTGLDRLLDMIMVLAGPAGQVLALVKPQFEAGRQEASRGRGVIREPQVWERVLVETVAAARRRHFRVAGVDVSPIRGGAGNVEFFLWLGAAQSLLDDTVDHASIRAAVHRAGALP